MGTRHLIAVYAGGTHRVAQYGQWDGDPGGQGLVLLAFCQRRLSSPEGRASFLQRLGPARFLSAGEAGASTYQAPGWEVRHPQLSRDMSAQVLEWIDDRGSWASYVLADQLAFAQNSLFCEWAYVIDLDQLRLEVYRGFNQLALGPEDRFAPPAQPGVDHHASLSQGALAAEGSYQPVRLAASWSLDDLPQDSGAFLGAFHGGGV